MTLTKERCCQSKIGKKASFRFQDVGVVSWHAFGKIIEQARAIWQAAYGHACPGRAVGRSLYYKRCTFELPHHWSFTGLEGASGY